MDQKEFNEKVDAVKAEVDTAAVVFLDSPMQAVDLLEYFSEIVRCLLRINSLGLDFVQSRPSPRIEALDKKVTMIREALMQAEIEDGAGGSVLRLPGLI